MSTKTLGTQYRAFLNRLHYLETRAAAGACTTPLKLAALQKQSKRYGALFDELQGCLLSGERQRARRQLTAAWTQLQALLQTYESTAA